MLPGPATNLHPHGVISQILRYYALIILLSPNIGERIKYRIFGEVNGAKRTCCSFVCVPGVDFQEPDLKTLKRPINVSEGFRGSDL